jgi:hypothetical protein
MFKFNYSLKKYNLLFFTRGDNSELVINRIKGNVLNLYEEKYLDN